MNISIYLKGSAGVAALLVFGIFLSLAIHHPPEVILQKYEEFSGMWKEKQRVHGWYQRTEARLLRNGASFHYGNWITPGGYLLLRILCALAGCLILGKYAVGLGILCGMILYFLPEWMLFYLNKEDNRKMLPEIKLVYHALEIQIKAGVYVTDALAECYGSVQEKRLQQALLDLAGHIVMKADIYEALDGLQKKFDNRYIDSLCITILQACESGQAVDLLGDIGEQLKDMETALMYSKKVSLDRSITFYQLGILVAVLLVAVYACINYLFTAVTNL